VGSIDTVSEEEMIRVVVLLCTLAGRAAADAKADAQVHVDKAKTLHAGGKLTEALAELKEAYVLDPRAELLFAIGQIHVNLGQCTEAITYYERFLGTKPEPDAAAVTSEAIKACKEKPDAFVRPEPKPEPKPVPQPVPGPPPPPQLPPWYSDWIADALIGAGVISGVVGTALYFSARGDRSRADDVTSFQQYSDLIDSAQDKRYTAIVLGIAGAGLVAGGVVKWLLRERAYRRMHREWAIAPNAEGGGILTWTRAF
jgi:tetratricopeptide (TPR) repeat protein